MAASLVTLTDVPLWQRLVAGALVGALITTSAWVWRRSRAFLGFLTTWALLAVLWGFVLGVVGFVDADGKFAERVSIAVTWAGGGALIVMAWALFVIPPRYLWLSLRALRNRRRARTAPVRDAGERRWRRDERAKEKRRRAKKKAQRRRGRR